MSTRSRSIHLVRSSLLVFAGLATASAQAASAQTAATPVTVPTALAQAPVVKPDLNGTWKLNTAKSEFSPAPQPSAQTEIITLTGDDLAVAFTSSAEDGKQKYSYTLKLGGPEVPFPKPELNETALVILAQKAEWKDATLVITQKITYQGGAGTILNTYTLSADGKTLTKILNVAIDQGFFELKAVFDKA